VGTKIPPGTAERWVAERWQFADSAGNANLELLCKPSLAALSVRGLARLANVASGTVARLFDELEPLGNIVRREDVPRRFFPTDELLDRSHRGCSCSLT
jgi:hypothetical protein